MAFEINNLDQVYETSVRCMITRIKRDTYHQTSMKERGVPNSMDMPYIPSGGIVYA